MYDMNLNEITVTNRYGYAILTDESTGRAMVCEPTMAGPDIVAFVIVQRCEDYQTAHLAALSFHEAGLRATTYGEERADDDTQAQDEDEAASEAVLVGQIVATPDATTEQH